MNKRMIFLTLDSNGKQVAIPSDNVALAIEVDGETESHEKVQYTRVFLKQESDGIAYVDVKEKPKQIR